jgi:hypothetical protein
MTIREAIDILELEKPVRHEAIKKAFRDKAKIYHPDRHEGSQAQKIASDKFIEVRKASETLLSLSEAVINDPASHRRPDPIIRRAPRTPAPQSPVFTSPITAEFDNLIRLWRMLIGNNKEVKKTLFVFQPGSWLVMMYEFFIEKKFKAEENVNGFGFALFRFVRLLFGAIFLIAGFLLLSIFGMFISAVIFPPFIVFYGIYHLYQQLLDYQANKMNQEMKIKTKAAWLGMRKTYLQLRTFPVFGMILLGIGFHHLSTFGTFYVQSLSFVFTTLALLFLLSVCYEWLYFYRVSKKAE